MLIQLYSFVLLMQLFLCRDIKISWTQLIIQNNEELINQLKKVLRAQPWYEFAIQTDQQRYYLSLERRTNREVFAQIQKSLSIPAEKKAWMLIAFPNKQEKLELIIQKLTELWITHIYLRASERSVVSSLNENKKIRIQKIMKEATEQSWNWKLPNLEVIDTPQELFDEWSFVVFDLQNAEETLSFWPDSRPMLWVIGPEGGLTAKDYGNFPEQIQIFSLWNSVLRMETAAIIWAWKIKNP